jgi:hypothetical protein
MMMMHFLVDNYINETRKQRQWGRMLVGLGGQHYVQERWLILIGSHDIGRLVAIEAADLEILLL